MASFSGIVESRLFWFILGNLFSIFVSLAVKYIWNQYRSPSLQFTSLKEADGERYIGVKNDGNFVAKNCCGELLIELENNQLLSNTPDRNINRVLYEYSPDTEIRSNVCWRSIQSSNLQSINIEKVSLLSICKEMNDGIVVPSENGWEEASMLLSTDPQEYDEAINVTVKITAENSDSISKRQSWHIGNSGLTIESNQSL